MRNIGCLRAFAILLYPPLAVCDMGCGSFFIVFILTAAGWLPGVIAALIILNKKL
ncbi:MAG: YqaE/Pmp3 family membrane protein [Prevotellaceae bacterium]|nr:YqaE/Pmp3 family membrane protein [Candidatus Faecinaster equi]